MYFCTVNVNSKVVICKFSSGHCRQASKLSVLRRFELIWTDRDACVHQYNKNDKYYYYYQGHSVPVYLISSSNEEGVALQCLSLLLMQQTRINHLDVQQFSHILTPAASTQELLECLEAASVNDVRSNASVYIVTQLY